MSDPKIIIHSNEGIYFISYMLFLCSEHTITQKISIASFAVAAKDGLFWISIVTSPQLICDITWTWGTGIVTSYSWIVLACANWRKRDVK